jgi:thymidylate synthase
MKLYRGHSFAEAYKKSLTDLVQNPEYCVSPRGLKINENINVAHVIENPRLCLYENLKRGSQLKYIAAETVYYFAGRNDLGFISKFASFWNQIANDNKTVNSAYGNLIFNEEGVGGLTQWQWAYNSLLSDKDTRQAILLFNKPDYQYYGNRDFICTLNGIFVIRDNKLNFTIHMRSNDAILGTATDVAFFCLLQIQMLKLLKSDKYPELELGTFTHITNSYHIYERHFGLVKEMIESPFKPFSFPEIEQDFIISTGYPTSELENLTEAIEFNNIFYETKDNLFNWIIRKALS